MVLKAVVELIPCTSICLDCGHLVCVCVCVFTMVMTMVDILFMAGPCECSAVDRLAMLVGIVEQLKEDVWCANMKTTVLFLLSVHQSLTTTHDSE